jgi:hypothetical protein
MSNYLAIATVTATLQRLLQSVQLDVLGANVTTVRPDASGGTPEVGVNIYLYQATPNPAWRNADLRNRRPKGDLIKQAQAGLDLYYLFTFYGNEVELQPQRLLGSTIRILVDQPVLTAEMIQDTMNQPNFEFLQDSTLSDQVERVTIVPSFLSTDDLSKIWSVFFQTPYMLSFACQAGAVLIEGDRPSGRGLPIRSRQFYATPTQPVIERVLTAEGLGQPIGADSRLLIRGRQLAPEVTLEQLQAEQARSQQRDQPASALPRRGQPQVQIGMAKLTPQTVKDGELQLRLGDLTAAEKQPLRAGVQSLQVVYPLVQQLADWAAATQADWERTVSTNVVAFVLCPTLIEPSAHVRLREDHHISRVDITVTVDLLIDPGQRVFLLLNQFQADQPASYIFAAPKRTEALTMLTFSLRDLKAGHYLVRLQVDGAESPLEVEGEQFVRPRLDLS